MSETLITCENLGKRFCRDFKKSLWYGVKDSARDVFRRGNKNSEHRTAISKSNVSGRPLNTDMPALNMPELRAGEFWANQNVNFEVKRGECVGLIGKNGSGKTTLLKMLNGLIKPDHGAIRIKGRVGALIALGAGFNQILTGRENIYVNASIMGLSKAQIDDKIEEIVDFAEIGTSIDAPVRTYSSGMNVRLGFAIAAILVEPDVLLLDEVLAVGDAAFRHRCYSRMNKLMSTSAVVLVSHSMDFIAQCCNQVGLMDRGVMTHYDDVMDGIVQYNKKNFEGQRAGDDDSVRSIYPPVTFAEVSVAATTEYGQPLEIEVVIESTESLPIQLSFFATNVSQQPVICWHSSRSDQQFSLCPGRQTFRITIDPLLLHDGTYKYTLNASRLGGIEHIIWYTRVGEFTVSSRFRPVGNIPYLPDTSHCQHIVG